MAANEQDTATRVCSFESRRADDMRRLIERFGGVATVAPSMQEVPLDDHDEAIAFADELMAGAIDVVIFMTGVGARTVRDAVAAQRDDTRFLEALRSICLVARGPKPFAVLRGWGVEVDHRVPEPNTWRELLEVLDARVEVDGKTVAFQEYGKPNDELNDALRARGATVRQVRVYRWALPDDTQPLEQAVENTIAGAFDVLLFTSAQQLEHVLQVAESGGNRQAWLDAAAGLVVGSIGPTCSEAIAAAGLPVVVEASPPKMAHLVRQTLEFASARES